ncbi:hypothetical protein F949_01648 [Acinetobacter junii NIPH 182]|uniref:hypothetical protein n=1 Tax=Acinetobacter junii TaxID=40215 RepID=UPI0002CD8985|nr:hypothetical protein [Acinetobacter junii]ENV64259.1 hypothetical protein F949_01648 [Acinetobacter junii NIPH 182]
MNDFFLLNNESLPYVFVDQNIEIKQILVKDLNHISQFAGPIKKLESYSVETITPLIQTNILQIMGVVSLTTSLDPNSFSEQLENAVVIANLLLKIIEVNNDVFKKEPKSENEKGSSWFKAFSYLINHGHRHDEILNMTYGAFLKYLNAAQAIERQQIKSYAIATRVANNAKQQGWDKYLKQLNS